MTDATVAVAKAKGYESELVRTGRERAREWQRDDEMRARVSSNDREAEQVAREQEQRFLFPHISQPGFNPGFGF